MSTKKSDTTAATGALKLFDADETNPTFARFHPEAEQLTLTGKGLEQLFNWLETPEKLAIADLGARSRHALLEFDNNTAFFDTAAKFKTRIIVAFALHPTSDSIGLLKKLYTAVGGRVTWLIVRSTFAHGTWDLWESTEIRKDLIAAGATEIAAPKLDPDAWAALDRHSLTAAAGANDMRLTLVTRSYITRWRQNYMTEFDRGVAPLISEDSKTLFVVTGDKGGVGKSSDARALADWLLSTRAA